MRGEMQKLRYVRVKGYEARLSVQYRSSSSWLCRVDGHWRGRGGQDEPSEGRAQAEVAGYSSSYV
jgi:hypothetical protein